MKPIRLPWKGRNVPSALLDVVRGCNCSCKACFNRRPASAKPLADIRGDLAAIRRLRDVKTVGVTGGEPLLHPRIADVIRLIRDEGLSPSMLTNGILWNAETARELGAAGLDIVMFHVQPGQKRPDLPSDATAEDAFSLIAEKSAIASSCGIEGMAIATVNARHPREAESLMDAFLRCRECQYLWLTLERDLRTIGSGRELSAEGNGVSEMSALAARRGWRPFAGIGGALDHAKWRWMTFHGFVRLDPDGRVAGFASAPPSLFERAVFAVFRLFRVQLPYRLKAKRSGILLRLALNALAGGPVKNLAFVFAAVFRRQRVRPKHLVVEALPELSADGKIEHCDPCVDATVRDGKLFPPCLADADFDGRRNG